MGQPYGVGKDGLGNLYAYSGDSGRLFLWKAATDSCRSRPPIPEQAGHLIWQHQNGGFSVPMLPMLSSSLEPLLQPFLQMPFDDVL